MTTRADPPSPSATDDAAPGTPEADGASPRSGRRQGADELRRALREAELLNAVTADAAGEDDLGRILVAALERLHGVIPFTGGSIALRERATGGEDGDADDADDVLVIRAAVGPFSETALGQRSKRGAGRLWQVIDSGEPLLSGNVVADGLRRTSPFLSFLAVPLAWRRQTIGLIELDSTEEHAFDEADLALLRKVATALSGPVELARRRAAEVDAIAAAEAARRRSAEDIARLSRVEAELTARATQQTAVAALGQHALEGLDLDRLMDAAATVVAGTLGVEYCKVLELLPDGRALLLRAGVGWREGLVGRATVPNSLDSQAAYTLASHAPVIVDDLRTETRFDSPRLLHDHGVVSGLSVIIHGPRRPYGVLGAHTARRRSFSEDDVHFLQAIANVLGAAIERRRAEEQVVFQAQLLDQVQTAVIVTDLAGRVTHWNRHAEHLYGWREAEALGRPITELTVSSGDAGDAAEIVARVLAGDVWEGEFTVHRKDGSTFPAYVVDSPVYDAERRMVGIVGVSVDLSERRELEERLRHQLSFTGAITDSLGEGVYAVDREGRATFANPAAERLLGWRQEEFLGRHVHDTIHYQRADGTPYPREDCPLLGVLRSGRPAASDDDVFTRRDGTTFPVAYSSAPILQDGRVAGAAVSFRDVTEQRRAEEALRFLAEATSTLAASLDYETTLASVARLAVPRLADWCTVSVLEADGWVRRIAVAHADPATQALLAGLEPRYPLDAGATYGVPRVLRTGRPEFYPEYPAEVLRDFDGESDYMRTFRRVGYRSEMIVPLLARGRALGAISFVMSDSGRRYRPADLALAEDLARRAAVAVDNAWLYQEAQAAGEQLGRHAARLQTLADASRVFAEASLELPVLLERIARHIAATVGDFCLIRLLSEDRQQLDPVAIHHPDPAALAFWEGAARSQPYRVGEGLTGQVVATGEPRLVPRVSLDELGDPVRPEFRAYVERFGLASMLIVPLRVRGEPVGALFLGRQRAGNPYTPDDVTLLQDLADRAGQAIDNARLYRQAQEAVRVRDQFLSIASHELRTPVAGIKGYAQLLLRAQARGQLDQARLTRSLGAINDVTNHLDRLTRDLLDVSRLRTGQFLLEPRPIDLVALAREVAARYGDQLDARHRLALEAPVDAAPAVADPDRVEQVLLNLLENAAKYSPDGGEITLTVRPDADGVALAVRDEGIGLPPGAAERIFEPFGRATNALERSLPGLGLGLHICHDIVERHGGRMWAESPGEGQGTTVGFWLPTGTSSHE